MEGKAFNLLFAMKMLSLAYLFEEINPRTTRPKSHLKSKPEKMLITVK